MPEQPRAQPVKGVHHGAFRCLDAEQTRWFYCDVLGLKMAGGIVLDVVTGTGAEDPYMHIFFGMTNGEFIAFFDAPGSASEDAFARKESFDLHWAFELESEEAVLAMQERVRSFGIKCAGPIDHGFVRSIYMYDPNGIQIEFTVRTPDHDRIFAEEAAHFSQTLKTWSERTRAQKVAKFGAEALDRRASAPRT
ncbi:MAG: VOC family protein [Rhizomicrobium sp.]